MCIAADGEAEFARIFNPSAKHEQGSGLEAEETGHGIK
jgi:hypothetical protein